MKPSAQTEEISPVFEAKKSAKRTLVEYDIAPLLCLGEKVAKVAIRVPTKREQDLAWQRAHSYVDRLADGRESVSKNTDVLQDALAAHIVAMACRDPARPDKMPSFPDGAALGDVATPDEIAALLRLVLLVKAKHGPSPDTIDSERVEAFATMCAVGADGDGPDVVLAALPHAYLSQLYVLTCVKLAEARAEIEALRNPKVSDVPSDG